MKGKLLKMEVKKKMQITIDSANVKIENGKVTIDLNPEQFTALTCSNKVELSTLKSGDEFKLGDEVFIVLEQTDNGTRVISKKFAYNDVKFGDNSNWKESPIRKKLNNEYFRKIAGIIGENNILSMNRDLTSFYGSDYYGTCTDKVSLLTSVEYGRYRKILILKPDNPDLWWLITPVSTPGDDDYSCYVCCVYIGTMHSALRGVFSWCDRSCTIGVRPLLNLEPSISVLLNKD